MYLENPNIPVSKALSVLIDYRARKAEKELLKLNIQVYKTPEKDLAYTAISGHPDIMFHQVDREAIVVCPETESYFKSIFPNVIQGGKIGRTYPYDIAYNVARVGKFAFHNTKYTDKKIIEYYNKIGVKLINVKQGYTKCSVSVVSENAIITADRTIADAASENNIDVLLIKEGYVKLKNFTYGFIGGASGLISKEILAFNGCIENHPDYKNIKAFCRNYKVSVLSLHNEELEDIGSIIPIEEV